MFLMFEPGGKALKIYQSACTNWDVFIQYKDQLVSGNHDFKTICIDTGSLAYEQALKYAGEKYGFDHPGGQNDYGLSWNKVKKS
jgi:hypothetical protein